MNGCDWAAARQCAHGCARPLQPVELPAPETLGATLAAPLIAAAAMPPFDCSAMDGYAVAGDPPWRVVGVIAAGTAAVRPLGPGSAAEIATGALIPAGTLAVLPYEKADRSGDLVTGEVTAGRHIRRIGEAARAGADLAAAGTAVTAALLGLAASVGVDVLTVRRAARVTALIIGDEVRSSGLPGDGQIRDAIGPLLPGLVRGLGGELLDVARLGDTREELQAALRNASGDVVVTCGASSVGRSDTVRAVLDAVGARLLVDGVACRPGHPQALALLPDGRPLVALPGNPYAAVVASVTLLGPLLAGLTGRPLPELPVADLVGSLPARPGLTRLIPVSWHGGAVRPVGSARPASLQGAALAQALAVLGPNWSGGPVPLVPLPG